MNASSAAFCLALDVPDAATAAVWVARCAAQFSTFKIGLQLFCAEGPAVVDAVRKAGARRVFLDLKLHDIPNTVAAAVRSLRGLGVDELTIHTDGGREMMAAAQAEAGPVTLLGVTVLTSLDAAALTELGVPESPAEAVRRRAELAIASGLPGLVCAATDAADLRARLGAHVRLVTPGIRLPTGATGDQRRVATPGAARAAGSDLLVIGRPVLDAVDWSSAIEALHADWRGVDHVQ